MSRDETPSNIEWVTRGQVLSVAVPSSEWCAVRYQPAGAGAVASEVVIVRRDGWKGSWPPVAGDGIEVTTTTASRWVSDARRNRKEGSEP